MVTSHNGTYIIACIAVTIVIMSIIRLTIDINYNLTFDRTVRRTSHTVNLRTSLTTRCTNVTIETRLNGNSETFWMWNISFFLKEGNRTCHTQETVVIVTSTENLKVGNLSSRQRTYLCRSRRSRREFCHYQAFTHLKVVVLACNDTITTTLATMSKLHILETSIAKESELCTVTGSIRHHELTSEGSTRITLTTDGSITCHEITLTALIPYIIRTCGTITIKALSTESEALNSF